MYLAMNDTPVFLGTATSASARQQLRDAGFVHVTGLPVYDWQTKELAYHIGERLSEDQLGKWDQNNSLIVLVTTGGEVWLRAANNDFESIRAVVEDFAPNGKGAFVPLSNGEKVSTFQLLQRMANPNSGLAVQAS